MKSEGNAVVYCEGAFKTTYGKTAHGLVRFTERYNIITVIDSTCAGEDAGTVLENRKRDIPIIASLQEAEEFAKEKGIALSYFVIGIATDGGYLTDEILKAVEEALNAGLNIDSGLHDFLNDNKNLSELAALKNLKLRDIRKPASDSNHLFTGKINDVKAVKIALLGTDSAVGKRTTAWKLTHALKERGAYAEFIGTGQTAWLQGAEYGVIMDSLLNDYVSGELEHVVWKAWNEKRMDYAIIEGQGSLMNPGYPGGFEILAACRPDTIIMQHAPARTEYDGFPGYPLDSIEDQIFLAEFLSKKKVIAVTINDENIGSQNIDDVCLKIQKKIDRPVIAPLHHSLTSIVEKLEELRAGDEKCRKN